MYQKKAFKCPNCSDGISYPEKILYSLLKYLDVEFERQKVFTWSDNKRYDFYLPEPLNIILEIHGGQHYVNSFENVSGKSVKDEEDNDKYKYDLATKNNIKEYIVIDARHSDFVYIKNNIIESRLSSSLNIKELDWNAIFLESIISMKKKVMDILNNSDYFDCKEIASRLNIDNTTVYKYIKELTSQNMIDMERLNKKVFMLDLNFNIVKSWNKVNDVKHDKEYFKSHHHYMKVINSNSALNGFYWYYCTLADLRKITIKGSDDD